MCRNNGSCTFKSACQFQPKYVGSMFPTQIKILVKPFHFAGNVPAKYPSCAGNIFPTHVKIIEKPLHFVGSIPTEIYTVTFICRKVSYTYFSLCKKHSSKISIPYMCE